MSKRPAIVDFDDVVYREAIEALNLKQANEVFKNLRFSRYWPEFKKTFYGIVKRVDKDLPDAEGNIDDGFQFLIE
jgi:hypothetical protein